MNNRFRLFLPMTPVVKHLIIINVIIWAAVAFAPGRIGNFIMDYGALYYWNSPHFNPAQVFTYMFLHSQQSVTHVLFNMFSLWMFGTSIEMAVGSKRFLFYFVACGVGAALIQEGVYTLMISHYASLLPEGGLAELHARGAELISQGYNFSDYYMGKVNLLTNIPSVGASGAIYGILLAYGMLFPNRRVFVFPIPVPVKAWIMVLIWGVLELGLGVASPADGIAHFCHLGGMIAGIIILLYWRHKNTIGGSYY